MPHHSVRPGPVARDTTSADAGRGGLDSAEALARRRAQGPNALPQSEGRAWGRILAEVLAEPMLLLLLAAASIYFVLGDAFDAVALSLSALFVIGLAFVQQQRAETALRALRELASPRCVVLRDGSWHRLAASELVVGDLIDLREGDRVPADAELIGGIGVGLDESLLTGESAAVRRSAGRRDPEERRVRAGTLVVSGRAEARVTETGPRTELGRIGFALRAQRPRATRTQREMRRAVWLFSVLGFVSCLLVVLLYARQHGDWLHGLLAGITLAVANVPEEFPLVLTVFLAIGAWRLAQARVLVRRPPAIEALGAITVLCSDKTGTLTVNRMTVARLATPDRVGSVDGGMPPAFRSLVAQARLACQVEPFDPMDCALVALDGGQIDLARVVHTYPIEDSMPAFGQVWEGIDGALKVACKGAPETVVDLCRLAPEAREHALAQAQAMADAGLRVLGVASGEWSRSREALPDSLRGLELAWQGLVGFEDPLRAGVRDAVEEAHAAGIRVLMLTGDHPATARAIARQAGLPRATRVEVGPGLDELDETALDARIRGADVYARVRPEHKLRLVRSLKQKGEVVAMTGDGINDAPALALADVGIAMGQRGTDVAREAAGIVLLDDDFGTVVRGVRLGRTIYDNLRRAVCFVIAVHVPITGLALLPLLLGAPMLLQPLHVVFLELIVDPACSIVLEREPPARDVMRRPPRPTRQHLLDLGLLAAGLGQGSAVLLGVLAVYAAGTMLALPTAALGAVAFAALVASNVGLIWLNRTPRSQREATAPRNRAYPVLVLGAAAALVLATNLDPVPRWLGFVAVSPAATFAAALPPLLIVGLVALVRGGLRRRRAQAR